MPTVSFKQIRETNSRRSKRWHKDGEESWSLLEWAGAMCGEAGETANVAKKIRRYDAGMRNHKTPDRAVLLEMLASEIADTFLYLERLATEAGIDMEAAIIKTYNAVSEEYGFPEKLHDEGSEFWAAEAQRTPT